MGAEAETQVETLESGVAALESEKQCLSQKVGYLENQSRRDNLLLFGLGDRQPLEQSTA